METKPNGFKIDNVNGYGKATIGTEAAGYAQDAAQSNMDYGYGYDDPYGYGDAKPGGNPYGYGDGQPQEEASPRPRPKRRCSVTKFSLESAAEIQQQAMGQHRLAIEQLRQCKSVETPEKLVDSGYNTDPTVGASFSSASSCDSQDELEFVGSVDNPQEGRRKRKSMLGKFRKGLF